ncbi:MAG: type II secretion system protein [Armatimonadota bacterium]
MARHSAETANLRACPAKAFTLIETLVVVAIIGALTGMIFPVLARAKRGARTASCVNQLRQIGLAMAMYREDYGELAPRLSSLYPDHLPDRVVLVCPADAAAGSHPPNEYMEGRRYLRSGVSYTYLPNWKYAVKLGWWHRGPHYGQGKWLDSTPMAMCHWHWANEWVPTMDTPNWGEQPKGWVIVLDAGGTVRRIRAELPVEDYAPDGS